PDADDGLVPHDVCAAQRAVFAAAGVSRRPAHRAQSLRRVRRARGAAREMTTGTRLEALDVFRGTTVAAMILVSTPGTWEAVYWPLDHAAWHGWTPTDLVFPFLLFAMGAAVPLATAHRRGVAHRVRHHIIRRGLILFALGLVLNAIQTPAWPSFRIPGVLQRIAIVYVVVAALAERTSWRTQAAVAAASLLAYWAAMMLVPVPVPGVGRGVLTETGNLASFIDSRLLHGHMAH